MDRGAWQVTVHGVAKQWNMSLGLNNNNCVAHTIPGCNKTIEGFKFYLCQYPSLLMSKLKVEDTILSLNHTGTYQHIVTRLQISGFQPEFSVVQAPFL